MFIFIAWKPRWLLLTASIGKLSVFAYMLSIQNVAAKEEALGVHVAGCRCWLTLSGQPRSPASPVNQPFPAVEVT